MEHESILDKLDRNVLTIMFNLFSFFRAFIPKLFRAVWNILGGIGLCFSILYIAGVFNIGNFYFYYGEKSITYIEFKK